MFIEMKNYECSEINGGGFAQAVAATVGTIMIGAAPVIGVATGIGASMVGTPLVGISAGVAASAGVVAAGAACLDYASK